MSHDGNRTISLGLRAVIDQLGLKVPYPVVRSELTADARKTRVTDAEVLEQYPTSYKPAEGVIPQLRF